MNSHRPEREVRLAVERDQEVLVVFGDGSVLRARPLAASGESFTCVVVGRPSEVWYRDVHHIVRVRRSLEAL